MSLIRQGDSTNALNLSESKYGRTVTEFKSADLGLRHIELKPFEPPCNFCSLAHDVPSRSASTISLSGSSKKANIGTCVFSERPERVHHSILHDLPLDRVLIAGDLCANWCYPNLTMYFPGQKKLRLKAVYITGVSSLRNTSAM